MTREWTFTLTDTTKWYNLWYDLVLPTIADPTFSNSPLIPNIVQRIDFQVQTGGATVTKTDNTKLGGLQLTSTVVPPYSLIGETNEIDLKNQVLKTSANPTVVYVAIAAK